QISEDPELSDAERKQQIEAAVRNQAVVPPAECSEQFDGAILGLNIAGLTLDAAGVTVEAAAQFVPDLIIDLGLTQAGVEGAGIVIQGLGVLTGITGLIVEEVANAKPNCNAEFTGTVSSWANMTAGMGVSAHNGAIT